MLWFGFGFGYDFEVEFGFGFGFGLGLGLQLSLQFTPQEQNHRGYQGFGQQQQLNSLRISVRAT